MYKNGRPNGFGEIFYKNSIPSADSGLVYEVASYTGNFFQGKREGYGKMVWMDGSVFKGKWKND
jgi:hypothetical protein